MSPRKTSIRLLGQKLSDELLMQRLQAGQLEACSVLFERYHIPLYNFFLHSTSDRSLSEDLSQSVFERLMRYQHSFKPGNSFRSWIYQIARNLLYSHFQEKRLLLSPEIDLDKNYSESEDKSRINSQEYQDQLQLALGRIKKEHREIIVLCKLQGFTLKEAGQVLECSEGAAKVRMHRAMQQLRTQFFKSNSL